MRGKYKVPPNPLEQEALSEKLEPDEKWTDKQVLSLAMRLGKNGNSAEQTAAGMIISQVKQKQWRSDAGRRFLRGFFLFLLGRLPENVSKHSQFGQQPLYDDPEVRAYLEAFVQARTRFKVQLKKLTMSVPKGINQWYLYYKYIVLGKMLDPPNDPISDGTDIDYLDDWETFERAFDNAQGQDHFWPDHKWWPRPYRDKNDEAFDPFDPPPDDPPDNAGAPPPHPPRARPPAPPPAPRQPPPTVPPPGPDINGLLDNFRQQLENQHADHRAQIAHLMNNFQPPPPPPAPAAVAVPTANDIAGAFAPFHQAQIAAIQQTHAEQMRQLADYHARLSEQQEARHQQQVAWIQNNFPPPSDRPGVHSIDAETRQVAAAPQLSDPVHQGSFDIGGGGKGPEPPPAGAAVAVRGHSFSSSSQRQQNMPVPLNPEPVQLPQPVEQLTGGFGGPRPDPGSGPVLASTAQSMTDEERAAIAARATAEEQQRQEEAKQRFLDEYQQQVEAADRARQLAEQQAAEAQQTAANREAERQKLLAAYEAHQRAQAPAGKSHLTYEEFMANPHAAALQEQAEGFAGLWQESEAALVEKEKKHAALAQQLSQEKAAREAAELNVAAERRRVEAATAQVEKERRARHLQAEQQRMADEAREKEERARKAAELEQEQQRKAAPVQRNIAAFNDRTAAADDAGKVPPASTLALPAPPVTVPFTKPDTREPVLAQPLKRQATAPGVAQVTQVAEDVPRLTQQKQKAKMQIEDDDKPIMALKPREGTQKHPLVDPFQVAPGTKEATPVPKRAKAKVRQLPKQAAPGPPPVDPFKLSLEDQAAIEARKTTLANQRKARADRDAEESKRLSATNEKRLTLTREQQEKVFKGNAVAQKGTRRKTVKVAPPAAAQAATPMPHAVHIDRFVAKMAPSKGEQQAKQQAVARVSDAKKATGQAARKLALSSDQAKRLEKSVVKHALSKEEQVAKRTLVQHAEAKAAKLAGHHMLTAAEHHVPRPRLPAPAGKK